ncbi:hypothetical protein IEQ34_019857 [Dendrobium chrysotoxum]|uniref:Uncharacterized protein n=1 Tax=Dendrobium chrysotoxum TaxID=161865 RepID=A0AAV7G9M4_DENCH|nr:hypothetical protein IEQ34_019857 [Dendrobium chrysotoxum]
MIYSQKFNIVSPQIPEQKVVLYSLSCSLNNLSYLDTTICPMLNMISKPTLIAEGLGKNREKREERENISFTCKQEMLAANTIMNTCWFLKYNTLYKRITYVKKKTPHQSYMSYIAFHNYTHNNIYLISGVYDRVCNILKYAIVSYFHWIYIFIILIIYRSSVGDSNPISIFKDFDFNCMILPIIDLIVMIVIDISIQRKKISIIIDSSNMMIMIVKFKFPKDNQLKTLIRSVRQFKLDLLHFLEDSKGFERVLKEVLRLEEFELSENVKGYFGHFDPWLTGGQSESNKMQFNFQEVRIKGLDVIGDFGESSKRSQNELKFGGLPLETCHISVELIDLESEGILTIIFIKTSLDKIKVTTLFLLLYEFIIIASIIILFYCSCHWTVTIIDINTNTDLVICWALELIMCDVYINVLNASLFPLNDARVKRDKERSREEDIYTKFLPIFIVNILVWFHDFFSVSNFSTLELEPFGIHVINEVPGALRSNLGNSSLSYYDQMPVCKFYKPYAKIHKNIKFQNFWRIL